MKTEAQEVLIQHAPVLKSEELSVAGRRVLHLVDPAAAEEHERQQLEREEKRGWEDRGFSLSPDGTGRVRLSGHTDAEGAAIIRSVLDPLPPSLQDNRTAAQRRHDGLMEIVRLALATGGLPINGGDKAQLVVTVGFDPVKGAVGEGLLDTGDRLTPEAVRRIGCDAGIIPAILDGKGVPLDVGRERRLIGGALRRALVLRDRGCVFPSCDRPARWCQGHHVKSWLDNGETKLSNSVLVCGNHHVRHEALVFEGGVRPSRRAVAAVRLKLRAA